MSDDTKTNWWMEMDRQSDIDSLAGFKEAKQLLKESDKVSVPDDDEFFDRLHNKIMAGVEKTSVQKDTRPFWQRHRRALRNMTAAAMLGAVLLASLNTQQVHVSPDGTDIVLSDAVSRSPDIHETILVYQNQDDFFVDLAQESLDHLSVDNLQNLIGTGG
jgi:hypothetical protein